ncbi:phage major capsid protein, P2 family [Novosphingobium umbonatum]|uniref:Phage major capsid protein, P2 family n=1 Tax=Novosphingobium umbonatum TaxID=1908524 RepID=A0A3S2VBX1_9SPHN|nr:phage major capsid protein, P2 family [Novosphingobium umbonatum]RVU03938.1 phage major capsid protein, P2 family [Novosphingobium umbonatum]
MAYTLSDRGRLALQNYYSNILHANPSAAVHGIAHQFSLEPAVEQALEELQRESSAFLSLVNTIGVRDLKGQIIGIMTTNLVAGRTADKRNPRYIGTLSDREFELFDTEFDTMMPWQIIDQWSRFPNFATLYAKQVAISVALSRLMVGFNGTSVATVTNPTNNPLGQDVNIGWLQKLRLEKPDHVMGRATVTANGKTTATGAAQPIHIYEDGDFKNIDALAHALIGGMPSWARASTDHVVIVSQDLVDEKYFPMINRALSNTVDGGRAISDEIVSGIIWSQKQIGGRPAVIAPYFPEGTIAITPLNRAGQTNNSNLSIYYQEGSRRRYIKDEPENKRGLVDYNSVNEGYVIEDTDFMVMAENITFGAP